MSVEIRKDQQNFQGRLIVQSKDDNMSWEEVKDRVDALITAIAVVGDEDFQKPVLYHLTQILKDYLPTEEQWRKLLEP